MPDDAFVESQDEPRRSPRKLTLPLMADGSIDWDNALDKHKESFIEAIKADPNGILQNIREEAGAAAEVPEGIADTTVLAAANLVMVVEAIALSVFPGPRVVPQLQHLHPVIAIKACSVSMEDITPILEPGKRLIKEFVPEKFLDQKWQDVAVCAEHLAKVGAIKFQACLKLSYGNGSLQEKSSATESTDQWEGGY